MFMWWIAPVPKILPFISFGLCPCIKRLKMTAFVKEYHATLIYNARTVPPLVTFKQEEDRPSLSQFLRSKAWEWFDTALLVAKGKQVSWLHYTHHASTAVLTSMNMVSKNNLELRLSSDFNRIFCFLRDRFDSMAEHYLWPFGPLREGIFVGRRVLPVLTRLIFA